MEMELVQCTKILEGEIFPYISKVVPSDHFNQNMEANVHESEAHIFEESIECIRLEELPFSGEQYILTDYVPSSSTKVEITCQSSSGGCLFGGLSRGTSISGACGFDFEGNGCKAYFGSQQGSVDLPEGKVTIVVSQVGCLINGLIQHRFEQESFSGVYPLCIGSVYDTGYIESRMFSGKVSRVRISEDEEIVMDLVPAMTAGGSYGLFDLVSREFYQRMTPSGEKVSLTATPPLCFRTSAVLLDECRIYGTTAGVGDRMTSGINLFDKDNAQIVNIYPELNTGTVLDGSGSVNAHSLLMPLEPGTYTFSIYCPWGTIVRNRHRIVCYGSYPTLGTEMLAYSEAVVRNGDIVSVTFTAPAGTRFVLLFLWSGEEYSTAVINGVVENNQIMVEAGSTVSEYEPFSGNYVIPVTVHGKNLFDKDHPGISALAPDAVNNTTVQKNYQKASVIIPVEPGKTYVLSKDIVGGSSQHVVAGYSDYPASGAVPVFIDTTAETPQGSTRNVQRFTTPAGTRYILCFLRSQQEDDSFDQELPTIMLEEGTTSTAFEPYFSDTVTISADAPLWAGEILSLADLSEELSISALYENILTVDTAEQPGEVTIVYDY